MLGLLALATTLWLLRTVQRRSPEVGSSSPSRALWLVIPVSTAIALWFLSAPDPRFAWGQIVLLGAIPAAVAVASRLSGTAIPLTAAVAALTITPAAVAALVGINGTNSEEQTVVTFSQAPWTISAAITPVPSPDLMIYTLPTGEDLITPTADDRCWTAFPLCRPYPNDSLVFRGDSIQDGFASRLWDQ